VTFSPYPDFFNVLNLWKLSCLRSGVCVGVRDRVAFGGLQFYGVLGGEREVGWVGAG